MQPLPKKLKKEPLIDAVFEVRFVGVPSAGSALLNLLNRKLAGDKEIEQLPLLQVPQAIRDADPNLRFAPLNRLSWKQFYISIGDQSISIGFRYPYPGWSSFKPAIIDVMNVLESTDILKSVERYSLKYIDLLPSTDLREQISFVNFDVTLAKHKLEKEIFHIRVDIPRGEFVHAVQVISSATAILNNSEIREGLIVDVDTITSQQVGTFKDLLSGFPDKLEVIHLENKKVFFDCLTSQTINALEPEYEQC